MGMILTPIFQGGQRDWLAGYAYRKKFSIDHTKVPAALSNVPIYVPIASDSDLASRAMLDGSDIAFTNADGKTPLSFELVGANARLAANNGAWCWFSDPRGFKYSGTYNRVYWGTITVNGYILACQYDCDTGAVVTFDLNTGAWNENDDHDCPSFLRLSTGKIAAFWGMHGTGNAQFRITSNPEDFSAWGTKQAWGTTNLTGNIAGGNGHSYAYPVRLSSESNKIYVFFRSSPSMTHCVATTTEAGLASNTWDSYGANTAIQWVDTGSQYPYVKMCSNNTDTIYIAFSNSQPNTAVTNIYFAKLTGGNFYKMDGTLIGALSSGPLALAGFEKVYDNATDGRAWIWDIALDSNGYPVIAYVSFPGGTAGTAPNGCHYRYARWNGSAWVDNSLGVGSGAMYAGQIFYSGGMYLNHSDPSIVYVSVNDGTNGPDPADGHNFTIQKWVTADLGATWTHTNVSALTGNHYRPFCPWGVPDGDPLSVLWMNGSYTNYTNGYNTQLITNVDIPRASTAYKKEAYVKLPSVSNVSPTSFYLYYGKSGATSAANPTDLWPGYTWVNHLGDVDLGFYSRNDSAQGLKLQKVKGSVQLVVDAATKLGKGYTFPNAGQLYTPNVANMAGWTKFTLMGWLKTNANPNNSGMIASNYPSSGTKAAFYLRINSASKLLECWVMPASGTVYGGTFAKPGGTVDIADAAWHHFCIYYNSEDGSGLTAYIDNQVSATTYPKNEAMNATATQSAWNIGYSDHNSVSFNGLLDDFIIHPGIISADVRTIFYNNQNLGASFYSAIGSQENA